MRRKHVFPSSSSPLRTANVSSSQNTANRPVELVRCHGRGGIDFDKLETMRRRLGIEGDGERWPKELNDPALSRRVLGLDDE